MYDFRQVEGKLNLFFQLRHELRCHLNRIFFQIAARPVRAAVGVSVAHFFHVCQKIPVHAVREFIHIDAERLARAAAEICPDCRGYDFLDGDAGALDFSPAPGYIIVMDIDNIIIFRLRYSASTARSGLVILTMASTIIPFGHNNISIIFPKTMHKIHDFIYDFHKNS